jgi:hypothetical protein
MVETSVVVKGVPKMVARLKDLDPQLVKDFRKDLRKVAESTASKIKTQIGTTPPLSGMGGGYRTDWGGAKTGINTSFTGSRRADITPLLKIRVDAPKTAIGYMIAEKAGVRGSGSTPQGSNLIAVLTDRLGQIKGKGKGAQRQIAWRHFWAERPKLNAAAVQVVRDFEKTATGKLND